jgi:hypothetical protein
MAAHTRREPFGAVYEVFVKARPPEPSEPPGPAEPPEGRKPGEGDL